MIRDANMIDRGNNTTPCRPVALGGRRGWCRGLLWLWIFVGWGCRGDRAVDGRVCYSDELCVEPDGQKVYPDGRPICEGDACEEDGDDTDDTDDTDDGDDDDDGTPTAGCRCTASADDPDGDCITNAFEPANRQNNPDGDGDGIWDGCEDANRNGVVDPGESNPDSSDSDGDGIPDGDEDTNLNGRFDAGETIPYLADSDGDGIPDGVEDANHNGVVDVWVDANPLPNLPLGCYGDDPNDQPGETDPRAYDSDGDGIGDRVEDANRNGKYDPGETYVFHPDTDCDGLPDGKEDLNGNGVLNTGETDPHNPDSDGDGLLDGAEDANKNGVWDPGLETNALSVDSDGDGLPDGVEDRDHDGHVTTFFDLDANLNGCWDAGEGAPETDPRRADSDMDGLSDGLEDVDHDGFCSVVEVADPFDGTKTIRAFSETCAFVADTDCDGLLDGIEDRDHNGFRDIGETDPRRMDTDFDGLSDGCPLDADPRSCEDLNNDGERDTRSETDPSIADTDGDELTDGCEVYFGCATRPCDGSNPTDPLVEDTDGDGVADGDEDANHNCAFEPPGETDPRVGDDPPVAGQEEWPRWNVCATQNLKRLEFAESSRTTTDYRLAFEVEKAEIWQGKCASGSDCDDGHACAGGLCVADCPNQLDSECPSGAACEAGVCVSEGIYHVDAFGKDRGGNGFRASDLDDLLLGHLFQSPKGVVRDVATEELLHRDVYGFLLLDEGAPSLDDFLDGVRNSMPDLPSVTGLVELSTTPSRPAHDTLDVFRVSRAQRVWQLTTKGPMSAVALRNEILLSGYLHGDTPEPANLLTRDDLVYGAISCDPSSPTVIRCFSRFTVYVAAVKRLDQEGPNGEPTVINVVALTPDISDANDPSSSANRFYADKLTRLEDLTGGSALARFAAETSKACESLPQRRALADLLWVVDDSKSMQQIIDRLQRAARDAQAVLTANAEIVDFRVAMTTTNPSPGARMQCPNGCDSMCSGVCISCASAALGCIKQCTPACAHGNCTDGVCMCEPCDEDCVDTCIDPVDPGALAAGLAADARVWPMPGGGGQFYYEDPRLLDCDSRTEERDLAFINPCLDPPYSAEFGVFGSTPLTGNGRFLGSAPDDARCADPPLMDLRYKADVAGSDCGDASYAEQFCCPRLAEECDDGPTVLASQMCDLIRAMGGLPELYESNGSTSSGTRSHSAPEQGTRSARRLIETMLPALPRDYAGGKYDKTRHLRLDCDTGPNCQICNPRDPPVRGASGAACPLGTCEDALETCIEGQCMRRCEPVPLATLFLSDEEDYWFKDECATDLLFSDAGVTDKRQLPELCRYVDGDPATVEGCTYPEGHPSHDPDNPMAYCDQFLTGPASGYDPDQAMWVDSLTISAGDNFTLKGVDKNAPECAVGSDADPDNVSCRGDPCGALTIEECRCHPDDAASCDPNVGSAVEERYDFCYWRQNACHSVCGLYTLSSTEDKTVQRDNCEADARCSWAQGQSLLTDQHGACVLDQLPNDCQACKRLRRTREALFGETRASGEPLVGFDDVGPVYAIVRDKGVEGYGGVGSSGEDPCGGGSITWGRGDGQAYRDLAIKTLGRTQNVCASSYRSFMQTVIADMAVLSAPYVLSGKPIASTIKVGLSRRQGDGSYAFQSVERSRTRGFIYDATTNSIGFKSDPIDGQCTEGLCSVNRVIEESEIDFARTAAHVPRQGDLVYISYRLWRPVPCEGRCTESQACVRAICIDEGSGGACPSGDDVDCPAGYTCVNQLCQLSCEPGDLIDVCIDDVPCGACTTYNPQTGLCEAVGDLCACNPADALACNPNGLNACPPGLWCDESCICVATICADVIRADGTVSSCDGALACCQELSDRADACAEIADKPTCDADTDCVWSGDSGPCQIRYPLCCGAEEEVECRTNAETGTNSLSCIATPCSCPRCDAGFTCCVECGCQCVPNAG